MFVVLIKLKERNKMCELEDAVFNALLWDRLPSKKRVASHKGSELNFGNLKQKYPGVRVEKDGGNYTLVLPRVRTASRGRAALGLDQLRTALMFDNPDIDLEFDGDLASYVPDSGLIKKSVNPLWLVKKVSSNSFVIKKFI